MTILLWMPQVLADAGLKVAEVPGWQTRGRPGAFGPIRGVICHHTAGGLHGNMPSLGIITNGRPDLGGPLAQLGLGRDGTWYVVAAGRCNHAGAGAWMGQTSGNANFIGIEAENAGLKNDPWPEAQLDSYSRGVAAILREIGAVVMMCCGHKEYALPRGRKPDPDFDMGAFRTKVSIAMTAQLEGRTPKLIPAKSSTGHPTLRRGSIGAAVKAVQEAVGVSETGTFDAATEAAVRKFQRDCKLLPDGIVGPKTWAVIDPK